MKIIDKIRESWRRWKLRNSPEYEHLRIRENFDVVRELYLEDTRVYSLTIYQPDPNIFKYGDRIIVFDLHRNYRRYWVERAEKLAPQSDLALVRCTRCPMPDERKHPPTRLIHELKSMGHIP